jgi:hypothetical protein
MTPRVTHVCTTKTPLSDILSGLCVLQNGFDPRCIATLFLETMRTEKFVGKDVGGSLGFAARVPAGDCHIG